MTLRKKHIVITSIDYIVIDANWEKKKRTSKLVAEFFIDFSTSQDVAMNVRTSTKNRTWLYLIIFVAVNEDYFQKAIDV